MIRGAINDLVVGLDGSPESSTALVWAAGALAPAGRLHAVHVLSPTEELALDAVLGDSVELRHHREEELERTWLAPVADADVGVVPSVVEGGVAESLLAAAADVAADAIVVGHHPHARFGPRVVGHVAADLLHHAELPVVVVPGDWDQRSADGLPVAVGAGDPDATRAGLTWAMERAGAVGSGLLLVHARGHRSLFSVDGLFDVLAYHLDPSVIPDWIEEDLIALGDEIGRQTESDVDMTVTIGRGRAGPRLVDAGERAQLLVIGRGEPPFLGHHVMAPYLHHALAHAPCPIVVVPIDKGE